MFMSLQILVILLESVMSKPGPEPRKGGAAHYKVGCRLNDQELNALRRYVSSTGLSVAEYIRASILKKRVPVVALGEPAHYDEELWENIDD